ncbi:MAG TPA: SGNH/GDSL hydrolase family protein [Amycolatopsis sp.]|uniref:SGNH/GDSL hydrolase family protein n=1 Tax=Amycolatopsis sp. TaxID=37632 RepID=UPI002B45B462|nr:SGNH/GDSL hydrolase family protein [Amycolatopsis sp.]HKS45985.1 SGNH/GDSL hydrolase family protein [Amycolatopsis sp.]
MRRLVIVAVVAFTMLASAVTASASPSHRFRHYVALGDSYTAGPLIPSQRLYPLGCFRSTSNYPAQLAIRLGVWSFTDVSCSGADTGDMTAAQDVTLGQNPPQLDALRPNTDLVTLGIGGNDYDVFGNVVGTCPTLRESDPVGNPCQRHFTVDGIDTAMAAIAHTKDNIVAVLSEIHARAPRAKVLAIGYPRIAPPTGTCPDILPFADGDYGWLNHVEEALNAAVSSAAATDGKTAYIDTYHPSLGHDACSAAPWINGQETKTLEAAAYHPYYAGMRGVARVISRFLY